MTDAQVYVTLAGSPNARRRASEGGVVRTKCISTADMAAQMGHMSADTLHIARDQPDRLPPALSRSSLSRAGPRPSWPASPR